MDGYNKLAGYIGTYPDLAVFRKFLILNARNLLILQAEIVNLDKDLRATVAEDRVAEDATRALFEFSVYELKRAHESGHQGLQWKKTLELRRLLKEYSMWPKILCAGVTAADLCSDEALRQFCWLCHLAPADKSDLDSLRDWLRRPTGGNRFLRGPERFTWDEDYENDLVSLTDRNRGKDMVSRWIDRRLMPLYHNALGRKVHNPVSVVGPWAPSGLVAPLHYYPDTYVARAVNTLSTVLASLLPTMSAFALFFITDPLTRMGAIVALTFLFSTTLALLTEVRRAENFAASAAFAAVQIVFVGNNNVTIS